MIKRILRAATGVIFFFVFLVFLLVAAFRFRLLNPLFWKTALDRGQVYQQLHGRLVESMAPLKEAIGRQQIDISSSEQMVAILTLDEKISESRLQELVEVNIDRILGYINGQSQELALYLPVKEWGLPAAALGQPALSNLTAETPVEDVLTAFGYQSDQSESVLEGIGNLKDLGGQLTVVWVVSLLLLLGLLAGHYFLGEGVVDRVNGAAWLVMISGFLAKLIGMGAGSLFELIAVGSKSPMTPWMAELGRSLVGQFFSLGATIGLIVGIAGAAVLLLMVYLTKQAKLVQEKLEISRKKKVFAFIIGVTLGFAVLSVLLVAAALPLGAKFNFSLSGPSAGMGVQFGGVEPSAEVVPSTMTELTESAYESDSGWKINYPKGWEVINDDSGEGFLRRPSEVETNWAAMEVRRVSHPQAVDDGGYLVGIKQELLSGKSGFKNLELVEEPSEKPVGQVKTFSFLFDYDGVIGGSQMRLRTYIVEFHPPVGSSFSVVSRVPVVSWERYGPVIRQAVETFALL